MVIMTTAKQKLAAFKNKVDKLVIGKNDSIEGFGTDMVIKKYTFAMDDRGEDLTKTLVCSNRVRGVIVDLNYDNTMILSDLVLHKNDLRIIFPTETELESDATHIYELEYDSNIYDISPIKVIGNCYDLGGVAKEIFASLQKQ